ncbi:MAG: transaldolase [Chloroflexota bacterium]
MTTLSDLAQLGQSIWYDNISRALIETGALESLLDDGVKGVTSNPSIFEKAIAGSTDYDEAILALVDTNLSAGQIYEVLALADIQRAADLLRPIYEETGGVDGYVSLEVAPALAHDTARTIVEARRLFNTLDRPNVMIKVPATPAGIGAIAALIGGGVNVNVTLIFSLAHYEAVAEAYLSGLEQRSAAGGDVSHIASVASFFISRVDSAIDALLVSAGNRNLQGKIGIANARVAYARFQQIFSGPRWETLVEKGARVQRPLWASTSTKNPAYPDTLYVDQLVGRDTVNTVPPATLKAFIDHGAPVAPLGEDAQAAREQLAQLAALGIDLDTVTQALQDEGVAAFARSFEALIASVAEKRREIGAQPQPENVAHPAGA